MKLKLLLCVFLSLPVVAGENFLSAVSVPKGLRKKLKSFEPSAAVYLSELGQYLIGSDDTTKANDPWLFLMNEDGTVEKKPVQMDGLEVMTDIESLSQDADGAIYVLSSQGLNKSGKDKPERNIFAKTVLNSAVITVENSIELRPLLLEALEVSDDPVLKKMRGQYEGFLDIEAHFTKDGELYVGLKEPQVEPSKAVILRLGRLDDIFAGEVLPTVWRTVDLSSEGEAINRLSDMAWKGSELWLTSTSEDGAGHLWRISEHTEEQMDAQITRVEDFTDAHPEGLAFNNEGGMLVLFDQGETGDGLYTILNK